MQERFHLAWESPFLSQALTSLGHEITICCMFNCCISHPQEKYIFHMSRKYTCHAADINTRESVAAVLCIAYDYFDCLKWPFV